MLNNKVLLIFLILISVILRFYQLGQIPPEVNIDEASQGYNAFSILKTGQDRFGQTAPILFRSFGSYQAPLYTYLTIIPTFFFGNSIFTIHFISAISGVLLTIITYLIVISSDLKNKKAYAFMAGLVVAVSPWPIFFSRVGAEANLGVAIFALSIFLFYLSLSRIILFIPACIILGLSTHAYYSERILSFLFLGIFIFLFRKTLLNHKKIITLGLVLFALTLIPHLLIANTDAFTKRVSQVQYINSPNTNTSLGSTRKFTAQYFIYFSPKSLFFDIDPQTGRSIPDLSSFYRWMVVPYIFGLFVLIKTKQTNLTKILISLVVISPIPAALTTDPFNTTRVLIFLWVASIIIAFGTIQIFSLIKPKLLQIFLAILLIATSALSLYISYFVLLKYERAERAYASIKLLEQIKPMQDKTFVIDSTRDLSTGIRYAYLLSFDPVKIQQRFKAAIGNNYYQNSNFEELYLLDNIEVRPVVWKEDIYKDQILVMDNLAVSKSQIDEHFLAPVFEITDHAGNIIFTAYQTNPLKKCQSDKDKLLHSPNCK